MDRSHFIPTRPKRRLGMGVVAVVTSLVRAGEPSVPPQATAVPVELEVFRAPTIKSTPLPKFPESERQNGREGWVIVNMMIDPKGKPYEATVVGSTGNAVFEQIALQAATDNFTFQPATRGGTSIDSSFSIKIFFNLDGVPNEAAPRFVTAYRDVHWAIEKGDRKRADQALAKLKVQNLYEDAFWNVASFGYHRIWGSEAEQLADLDRAVAGESEARYLPNDVFRSVLIAKLKLEIKRQDLGGALDTWKILKPIALKKDVAAFQSVIDQLIAIRNSPTVVRLPGQISGTASWNAKLFKNQFEIAVTAGHVADIKLRCEKQYLLLKYEAGLRYTVSPAAGDCGIELIGDPGTRFDLVQS
jgi:TonB family protein